MQSSQARCHTPRRDFLFLPDPEISAVPNGGVTGSMTAKVQTPARFMTREHRLAWLATGVAAGAGVCPGGIRWHSDSRVGVDRSVIGGRTMRWDRLVGEGLKSQYALDRLTQAGGTDPGP